MDDKETRRLGFRVRKNLTHQEVLELYVGAPTLFSIKLHHNGRFTRFPERTYVEGEENFIDLLDHDKFSLHEMDRILEKLVIKRTLKGSDLDFGLRALRSDANVIQFIKVIPECRVEEITDEELRAFDLDKVVRSRLLLGWNGDDKPEANQEVVDNSDEVVVNQEHTQYMHTDEVMDNHVHNVHTEEVVVNHVDNMHIEQVVENMNFHAAFNFSNIDLNDPNFDRFFGESPTVNVPKHDLAKATTVQEFEKEMDALKAFNSECHLWLSNIPAKHWSSSDFSADGKLRKVGTFGTCGKCGNKGHNSRSCNGRRVDGSGSSKAKKGGVKTTKAAKKDGKKAAVGTAMQGQVKPKKDVGICNKIHKQEP
ncbi:hypothetical protein M8C21_031899 [Ambrosia artemisiifolia]|uniref:CCHC-type domain-containing protein n=1 Tax=Ambrosia artemisiifolia TaxID=4212 RepID=A0AAD5CVZ2_AMBAR|nr:hypothetical protein M8C21_031899 [Ambrosia artemisiifolia]